MILISKCDEWSNHAGRLAKIVFGNELVWIKGSVGDPMPEIPEGDIISFLCPWVLPASVLDGRHAINFHPGSGNYPGVGAYNFALHEGATYYGAVCHRMEPQVDTGLHIMQREFRISPRDTVETLKFRTMIVMLEMFHGIIEFIAHDGIDALPAYHGGWRRKPFTRKQLNQLYKDFPNTRATVYPDAN